MIVGQTSSIFHPEYTYDISNDDEEIIGYENLKIFIDFMASSLYPLITINYDSKTEDAEDLLLKFNEIFEDGKAQNLSKSFLLK
jgi:hypothetical protein